MTSRPGSTILVKEKSNVHLGEVDIEAKDSVPDVEVKHLPSTSTLSPTESDPEEDEDQKEADQEPLLICKLIVKYPTASFLISLSVFFLAFVISGVLVVTGYKLFPIEFTRLPLYQNNEIYLQRYYAWRYRFADENPLIERVPTSLIISGNRTVAGDKVELIFETKDGSNIFTKSHLEAIQAIQAQVIAVPNFGSYCRLSSAGSSTCKPPVSPISYFDGSYASENPSWNDPSFSSISSILYSAYINANHTSDVRKFLGKNAVLTATEATSSITRCIIELGYPLESGGTRTEQQDKLKDFLSVNVLGILRQHQKSPPSGMDFFFYSLQLFRLDILSQAFKDMALAAGSFFFIFIFVCIQTQSAWIGGWSIFSILGSFVIANLIYCCIIGYQYFGFFHILSIFIILGIGADDVFIFVDTWRDSSHRTFKSLEHRFSFVYRRAAIAMAVTSLTTMAAFLVSSASPFIAIHSFGTFSAVLVLIDYIGVITFFPCVLMLHHLKVSHWCGCCKSDNVVTPVHGANKTEKDGETERDDKDKNIFVRFFKGPYFRFISHRIARWFILSGFLAILGVAIYFCTRLQPSDEALKLYKDSNNFAKADYRRLYGFKPSNADEKVKVVMVWGLKPQDMTSCHFSNVTCVGKTVFDDTFDMNSASAQYALSNLCKKLHSPTQDEITELDLLVDEVTNATATNCFMTNFETYLQTINLSIPLNESNVKPFMTSKPAIYGSPVSVATGFNRYFEVMVMYWLTSGYTYSRTKDFITYNALLGEAISSDTNNFTVGTIPAYWATRLKFVGIEVNITLNRRTLGYPRGLPVAAKWENFMTNLVKTYPSGVKNGWQEARSWQWLETQKVLVMNALIGIGVGIALSLIILSVTTFNIIIALIATLSITGTTTSVLAVIDMAGWKLGVLESLNMCLVVGLAVDYVVHFAEAYNRSPHWGRLKRTQDALEQVGVSVLSGAMTTLGASFFMLFAQILFFVQFGIFMFATISFSFLFSVGFFPTFMALCGPEGEFGSCRCKACK